MSKNPYESTSDFTQQSQANLYPSAYPPQQGGPQQGYNPHDGTWE